MRKLDPAKHEEKKCQILKAAGACFVRDGFQGTSISKICAEAGISAGHLYHYFDSKEAIIGAMTEYGLEMAASRFDEMARKTNAIDAMLSEIGKLPASKDLSPAALAIEFIAEASRNEAVAESVRRHSQGVRTLLTGFIGTSQERGQIDPCLDPSVTAALLIGVIDGMKCLSIKETDFDTSTLMEMVKVMFTRFLTPPARGADLAAP